MDMTKFIVARSDQLNADDLISGPITVTIERVTGNDSADQPVSVHYVGDGGKPFKPCKSMRRVMVHVWGIDAKQYAGKSMTLRRDPEVQFGGMKVGGIRISHMSGIDAERSMALNATRGKKALYKVLPLTDAPKQQPIMVPEEVVKRLQEAAAKGMSALEAAWRTKDIAPYRPELEPRLSALKETARAADAAKDFGSEPEPAQPQQTEAGGYDGA